MAEYETHDQDILVIRAGGADLRVATYPDNALQARLS